MTAPRIAALTRLLASHLRSRYVSKESSLSAAEFCAIQNSRFYVHWICPLGLLSETVDLISTHF